MVSARAKPCSVATPPRGSPRRRRPPGGVVMSAEVRASSRVIVVLGMHRGGTSAATRALECLGVQLGDQLLAPSPTENPLGFYEDAPLLALSDRVLDLLGLSWDSSRLVDAAEWRRPELAALELEAAESIRSRFEGRPIWGFKNPRTARLLPFWQRVFARVGREDAYVVVVRNPLSVARSLYARNRFAPTKSHLLWLLHMTEAVVHTRGRARVCVDYDRLLADPTRELERIASGIGLSDPAADPERLTDFTTGFLTTDYRNSQFEASDLELDADLSQLGRQAYSLLSRWASDDDAPSEAQLHRSFAQISRRLAELAPLLRHVNTLDDELVRSNREMKELQGASAERSNELALRTSELDVSRVQLEERGGELALRTSELDASRAQL